MTKKLNQNIPLSGMSKPGDNRGESKEITNSLIVQRKPKKPGSAGNKVFQKHNKRMFLITETTRQMGKRNRL